MTREEIIQAISDDKMMPFIQPEQLAGIVDFVIKNCQPSLPSDLDEAAEEFYKEIECYPPSLPLYNKHVRDAFIAGAEWQKAKMGEQAREQLAKDEITLADLVAFDEGCSLGRRLERQNMMKEAIEIKVKEDAGGFPVVPLDAIELYDYENDKPLAKAGDKVRVIVIKED